mmetsp:Transcript_55972/g.97696  ORF Transcript_55972/g.97696 Transcript_55972/m.97696 type:complete len:106 (-) Transcript_55972:726-1043(-)
MHDFNQNALEPQHHCPFHPSLRGVWAKTGGLHVLIWNQCFAGIDALVPPPLRYLTSEIIRSKRVEISTMTILTTDLTHVYQQVHVGKHLRGVAGHLGDNTDGNLL